MIENFRQAFLFLPVAVALTDASADITAISDEAARIFGQPPERLIGASLLQLIEMLEEPDSPLSLETFAEGAQSGRSWQGKVEIEGEGGSKGFLLDVRPLSSDTEFSGLLFLFKPLVEDDHLARHEYKLELLGGLAGGVAHDLNNVLAGILGHISFLRLSLPEVGPHVESLDVIEEGARMAASISNQVLEFTRGTPAKKKWLLLSKVISGSSNLLRSSLPKEVVLSLVVSERPLYVFGEESLLSQMFMNLAINARDALPDGGTIDVVLEPTVIRRASGLRPGTYAKLTVSDNGTGIPEEIRARIFEPFFTTKVKLGTGLGLANVFSIVEGYSGSISVKSEVGKGSTFEILLPARTQPSDRLTRSHPEPRTSGGSETILVVEDEDIVRTVMQRSLEHLGYAVETVRDGEEGIAVYRAQKSKFGLVILDMMMPGMSGDEVFAALREFDPQVKVLIASGYSSDSRVRAVIEAGARGFIQKPFAVEELARKVRQCLA